MRWALAIMVLLALGGTGALILIEPSDTDHAAATSRDVILPMRDPLGSGPLDGLRFDTVMGVQGKPAELVDYLQFSKGLFMSRECTDRCNYPPSAYLSRKVDGGTDFIVEAFCPTKSTTMVWRGQIRGETVRGTVTWTSRRWYWTTTTVLEFTGALSPDPVDMVFAG